jgi:hypothetical protein
MTSDYQEHEYTPREDVRENDEEEDTVTQADIDLAQQDLRDREEDFATAFDLSRKAYQEVLKAKANRDDLKANLGKPKPF